MASTDPRLQGIDINLLPKIQAMWSCVTRMSRPLSPAVRLNVWPTVAWATAKIFIRDIADAVRIHVPAGVATPLCR